jgi:hypothetical protein
MEESLKKTRDSETHISHDVPTSQQPEVEDVYERLGQMRGKVRFSRTWEELKEDR